MAAEGQNEFNFHLLFKEKNKYQVKVQSSIISARYHFSPSFFFVQGERSRRIPTALIGGFTNYIKDKKVIENYNQALGFYRKDPN